MPTTRPRYTVTDTGQLREMLDLAQRRWPECRDRRQLLLRLAGVGRDRVQADLERSDRHVRVERQREALARAADLLDSGVLLSDAAWR